MIIIIIMGLCFCTNHSYCITIIIVEMEDLEMEISWTLKVLYVTKYEALEASFEVLLK